MIILSSIKLEEALALDSLSSWEKAKYIVLSVILYSLSGPIYMITPSYGPEPPLFSTIFSMVSWPLPLVVTYFGIKKCYLTNKTIDDSVFIERFTILYVPMLFKFILILVPLFLILLLLVHNIIDNNQLYQKILPVAMSILVPVGTYVFFLLLNKSFIRLHQLIIKEP